MSAFLRGSSDQNENRNAPKRELGREKNRGGAGRGRGSGFPFGCVASNLLEIVKNSGDSIKRNTNVKMSIAVKQKIHSMLEDIQLPSIRDVINSEYNYNKFDAYNYIEDSQFKQHFLIIISGNIQNNLSNVMMMESKLVKDEDIDKTLLGNLRAIHSNDQYYKMFEFRRMLPAFQMKQTILDLIDQNQVILISGETGCGKTTQVAQFILDNEIERGKGSITSIVCTQPRRISARSVAKRIAEERGEQLGQSIGYKIRLESILPKEHGNILFCTNGMLLKFMQSDPALRNYSHIILDEIHERSTESDFIIALLKQVIPKRPDLKVILMSATLNVEKFSSYYNNCPILNIPGFTYPVKEFYIEDVLYMLRVEEHMSANRIHDDFKHLTIENESTNKFKNINRPPVQNHYPQYLLNELSRLTNNDEISLELIEELTHHICFKEGPGAILIFLPGMAIITELYTMLTNDVRFPKEKFVVYPLHSLMPSVDQQEIFNTPPDGVRKIVIATNVAETSITIPDVVYVIDSGKANIKKFDFHKNIETLQTEWISLANAKQRKGRAGRVQPGICYHLYTRQRESQMEKFQKPELLCTRLENAILQVKILQLGKAETFLSTVLDSPNPKTIELSINLLKNLNALDDEEKLTPLGYHLAQLPLDPRTGKMIIWASLFSCLDPILSIAASLSYKNAFYSPIGKEDDALKMKQKLSMGENSDHVAFAMALDSYEEIEENEEWSDVKEFCSDMFLSAHTLKQLKDMKKQFAAYLYEMKFLNSDDPKNFFSNQNSTNMEVIKTVICAGLYPNIATLSGVYCNKKIDLILTTLEKETAKIHSASVNASNSNIQFPFFTYFLKRRTKQIFLYDTTNLSPNALLMGSPFSDCVYDKRTGKINTTRHAPQDIIICCEPNHVDILQKLHDKLNDVLEYKITHPGESKWKQDEEQILKAFVAFVSQKC